MSPMERNLFALAERLHTPVYELKRNMGMAEFMQWCEYFSVDNKTEQLSGSSSTESILRGFGI